MATKVLISVENYGDMTVELYPGTTPITVKNFLKLAKSGFYEGLVFHRVIPGFMIQGGGMDADFQSKNAKCIYGEFADNGYKLNNVRHTRGVISMARTSEPDSASSQFFIMHDSAPYLDGKYAAFGKVIEGIDVVDKIANVKTTSHGFYNDVPVNPVVIKSVTVIEETI